jgi:hypothetical protein
MAIILGNNPKDFQRPVEVVRFGGGKDSISLTFIYRTKREFAALVDERAAATRAKEKEADDVLQANGGVAAPISVEGAYLEWSKEQAEYVLQIASKWDLKDEMTVEKLQQLEDEFPGALEHIQSVYQKAVAEVRIKN